LNELPFVYIPNSFTPNADGNNDIFKPSLVGFDTEEYNLQIFNRWGELVFETNDVEQGWDGTFKSSYNSQVGVYTWKVLLKETVSLKKYIKSGHVSVLR
jgi:gliding motility-associated-like protein